MIKKIFLLLMCVSLLAIPGEALAKKKGKKKKKNNKKPPTYQVIDPDAQGYYTNIGKKQVYCLNDTQPGTTKTADGEVRFTSLKTQIKKAKNDPKKRKALSDLEKKAKKDCKLRPATSLARYEGEFGRKQAIRLLRVATSAAPPAEVDALVALGLEGAVNRIIDTVISQPELQAQMDDVMCDTYFVGEEENDDSECIGINGFSRDGLRHAFLHWYLQSGNRFNARLTLALHDLVASSIDALDNCEKFAAVEYFNLLRGTASTGSLPDLIRAMTRSHLIHLAYLSGYQNKGTIGGVYEFNEDFPREIMELFTTGKFGLAADGTLTGEPRYDDNDIQSATRALTGNSRQTLDVEDGDDICYPAHSVAAVDKAPKIMWAGKPWQTVINGSDTVDDRDELAEALIRNEATSEYWARYLWTTFVNGNPSRAAVLEAAQVFREKNLNIKELLRVFFMSKAFYAPDSYHTLYKHGVETVVDVLLTTGIPRPNIREMNNYAANLGQSLLRPPSVFSWHTYRTTYVSARYILPHRNTIRDLVGLWDEEGLQDEGFDVFTHFLADEPSADVFVRRWSELLGVDLNDAQVQFMVDYMNYYFDNQGRPVRDVFDPVRGSQNAISRTFGSLMIMFELPKFSVK